MTVEYIAHSKSIESYDPHTGQREWNKFETKVSFGKKETYQEATVKAIEVVNDGFKLVLKPNSIPVSKDSVFYNGNGITKEDIEINAQYEKVKKGVEQAVTQDEAHEIIRQSEFKLSIDLKKIAESKPKK